LPVWCQRVKPCRKRRLNQPLYRSWRYAAKVGVTTPALRQVANIVWDYSDQSNNIRLFGPLGVGLVKMQFDQYGVQLTDNRGRVHTGVSAEKLISDIAGWPIPIDALSQWLFVLPLDGAGYRYQLDGDGNVALLEQLGWRIEYSDYQSYGEKFLPRKIVANKPLNENGPVVVKLITKNWQ